MKLNMCAVQYKEKTPELRGKMLCVQKKKKENREK